MRGVRSLGSRFACQDGGGLDIEEFDSPEAFFVNLTEQAPTRLVSMTAAVDRPPLHVCLWMGRRQSQTSGNASEPFARISDPGVIVDVTSEREGDDATVARVRDRIAAAVSRGGYARSQEPVRGSGSDKELSVALCDAIRHRRKRHCVGHGGLGFVFGALISAVFLWQSPRLSASRPPSAATKEEITAACVVMPIVAFMLLRNLMLPPVALGERTFGARRLAKSLSLGAVLTALFQFVLRQV